MAPERSQIRVHGVCFHDKNLVRGALEYMQQTQKAHLIHDRRSKYPNSLQRCVGLTQKAGPLSSIYLHHDNNLKGFYTWKQYRDRMFAQEAARLNIHSSQGNAQVLKQ